MSLQQRKYYRIFSGSNQSEGNENIHLGYNANTTEYTFNKDSTSFFHVPFFTTINSLGSSNLLADGAIPGPIPAASDRIFKKQGNYGSHTPWGHNTNVQDGTWLCSWFCSLTGETPQWLDRYYNPGVLSYQQALQGTATFSDYAKSDPAFVDVPTQMTLEPGVLYQYFHQGESSAAAICDTFAGDNKDRLRLKISSYGSALLDESIYGNTGSISNFIQPWSSWETDPNYVSSNYLNLNNTDFINAKVLYDKSYNMDQQFTLAVNIKHSDWSNATSSQIVGNNFQGGYGIFFNNLEYYPFVIVPENTYGHVLFFNQEHKNFLDLSTKTGVYSNSNPIQISLNEERDVYVLDSTVDSSNSAQNTLTKYTHTGDAVAYPSRSDNSVVIIQGQSPQFIIDTDNNINVFTTTNTYTFSKDLILLSTVSSGILSGTQIAYDMTGTLVQQTNVNDLVFDSNNNKWTVNIAGDVSVNDKVRSDITPDAQRIVISPDNNIWIVSNTNNITVVNGITLQIIKSFTVGNPVQNIKNISFVKIYNRDANTSSWYSVMYYDTDKILYYVDLNGVTQKSIIINTSSNIVQDAIQDSVNFTFTGQGDFTGYEWSRINNSLKYNNNPQIQFKFSATTGVLGSPLIQEVLSVPVQYLVNNTWYVVVVVYSSRAAKLYINDILRSSLELPGNMDLSYTRKNNLYIGTPCGRSTNFNTEINSKSCIFNGYIGDIRIYDYPISQNFLRYFINAKVLGVDLVWNIQTADIQYIEQIEKFFKNKMPGAKSIFFRIKMSGTQITDLTTRGIIETHIKDIIQRTKPAYTELLSIEWIN
jgi:hypothetical protein